MGVGAAIALLCGPLTGCVSTQHKNERAKLSATRLLASREPLRVTARNPHVRVAGVALVRGRKSSAIVVRLRSDAATPLTDVPVAVGVRLPGGRPLSLNARRGLDWFQTHVPAIPAGGTATWVVTTTLRVPGGARPFARAGVPAVPPISRAGALPQIQATVVPPARTGGREGRSARERRRAPGAVRVTVANRSDVPQYGLQLYAVVRRDGRTIAAGRTTVRHLGTSARATAVVRLVGAAQGRPAQVEALPAIFD